MAKTLARPLLAAPLLAVLLAGCGGPLRPALLLELPEYCGTPAGLAGLPDGSFVLAVPNYGDDSYPPVLMKVSPDNEASLLGRLAAGPRTRRAGPMGLCAAPGGDLYLADMQYFFGAEAKSRLLRVVMKDGAAVGTVTVAEGFYAASGVAVHDGHVYVSDAVLDPTSRPLVSGVFRFKLGQSPVKLTKPLADDPHLIATIKTFSPRIGLGAAGLTFDSQGNLYVANLGDGSLHRIEFDGTGRVASNTVFAAARCMRSCGGIFCETLTDRIYVADPAFNAVHVVSPDGSVRTLSRNGNTRGAGGALDQPWDVLVRGNELIVSNMDWPFPGLVNRKHDSPQTLSVIRLAEPGRK